MTKNPSQKFSAKYKEILANTPVTYSIQYLNCSNSDCISCLMGQGHGPYWFAAFEMGFETRSIFLGKTFKPIDLNKVLLNDMLHRKQQEMKSQNSQVDQTIPKKKKNKAYFVDRVEVSKILKQKSTRKTASKTIPSKYDFERDLILLKSITLPERLKSVYKKLIKKYHPDQYSGNPLMNQWMSEINCEYNKTMNQANELA